MTTNTTHTSETNGHSHTSTTAGGGPIGTVEQTGKTDAAGGYKGGDTDHAETLGAAGGPAKSGGSGEHSGILGGTEAGGGTGHGGTRNANANTTGSGQNIGAGGGDTGHGGGASGVGGSGTTRTAAREGAAFSRVGGSLIAQIAGKVRLAGNRLLNLFCSLSVGSPACVDAPWNAEYDGLGIS